MAVEVRRAEKKFDNTTVRKKSDKTNLPKNKIELELEKKK